MTMGRPKLEIPRNKIINIRVTEDEFKKISRISKQKNLTKTAAILQGIDLLEQFKPKKFKNISGNNQKNSNGVLNED